MLADMGEHRATRVAYKQRILSLKMPSKLVDITSPSGHRMETYETLGVPEVWRYTKQRGLVIYTLESSNYAVLDVFEEEPLPPHSTL